MTLSTRWSGLLIQRLAKIVGALSQPLSSGRSRWQITPARRSYHQLDGHL
jgi:hypothetical protein